MHETSLAQSIYETACRIAAEHHSLHLDSVKVAVGEFSAVEPDLLLFAWEAVTAESCAAGCTLEIQWCRARQFCRQCNAEKDRAEGSWLRLCGDCGQPLVVEGGNDLDILQVSFTTADEGLEG